MGDREKEEIQPPEELTTRQVQPHICPPLPLEEHLEALKAEVEELAREKSQFREMLQRSQADFINYKRRAEEERDEQQKYSSARLILKLLPVVDDLNLALTHAPKAEAETSWLEGIKLIHRKLYSFLESENVTKIEVEGREFDPSEHEAMAYQESCDHQEGQILMVARDGYKLHGRVIRPALVTLARKPGTAEEEESSPPTGKETENA